MAGEGGGGGIAVTTKPPFSLGSLLGAELGWGSSLRWAGARPNRGEHTINFLRVPLRLERFISFGHAVCADLFLFHFTWLPLRFAYAVAAGCAALGRAVAKRGGGQQRGPSFGRAQVYDLLKGAILITATLVLGLVQVSRVYHYIRGEAVIKLYVVYNVLGVVDALFSSLGQDIMDALYRTTRDHLQSWHDDDGQAAATPTPTAAAVTSVAATAAPPSGAGTLSGRATLLRLAAHFTIAVGYVTLHACVIFVQIVCLNVAMNSKNNALLTLLVSSNFVELKGTVFKRFEAENLFQVACSDAVERFTLSLFLVLIGLQELTSWAALARILPSICVIWGAEVAVDYVKHSFTSKFNRLSADLFTTFSAILAHDIIAVRQRIANSLDPTHACVRRLGLATLPLACVVLRMAMAKVGPAWLPRLDSLPGWVAIATFFAVLFAAKTLLNMLLLLHAAAVIREQQDILGWAVVRATPQLAAAAAAAVAASAAARSGSAAAPAALPRSASGAAAAPSATSSVSASLGGSAQLLPLTSTSEWGSAPGEGSGSPSPHYGGGGGGGGAAGGLRRRKPPRHSTATSAATSRGGEAGDGVAGGEEAESVEALLMMEQISTVDRWALRAKGIPV